MLGEGSDARTENILGRGGNGVTGGNSASCVSTNRMITTRNETGNEEPMKQTSEETEKRNEQNAKEIGQHIIL
jgi:hypothetical protein